MNSSCGGGALLTVSSTTIVSLSLLLEFLRGFGEWCRISSTICSLSDTEDATRGDGLRGDDLRGEERGLRGGDRDRRRMTSSSTTEDRP